MRVEVVHKNQDVVTPPPARLLEKPAADSVAKEEDAPHHQAETMDVVMAK